MSRFLGERYHTGKKPLMHKPVMGGNTVSKDFHAHVSPPKCVKFRKPAQAVNLERDG